MIHPGAPFRLATPEDGPVLAQLVNFAGEGLPEYLWRQMAAPGEDPWAIGAARQAKRAEQGEIFVIDDGEGPVAGLTGYAIPAEPEPVPADFPALFRPLQELENLAPATWYVNVLAALPDHRGKGHGTLLLQLAERIARASSLDAMSLIVADNNADARRLYERQGYRERARRTMVRQAWETAGREWLLLVRPLPAS